MLQPPGQTMSEGHDPHHLVDEHMLCRVGPETTLSAMMAISALLLSTEEQLTSSSFRKDEA